MMDLVRDWLLDPAALLFMSSLGLLIMTRWRSRRQQSSGLWVIFFVAWLAFFALSTAPVIVNPAIEVIEQSAQPAAACTRGSHIIVLGGGVSSRARSRDDFHMMRPATFVRATEAAQLAFAEPDVKLILAGGTLHEVPEAEVIAAYLMALGISESRLILESESNSTRENAVNVLRLLDNQEAVTGSVRLVTSALHMPRALGTFERVNTNAGIQLCPVSVDFQGLSNPPFYAWMPQTTSLIKFDLLIHEVIAWLVYRVQGWV